VQLLLDAASRETRLRRLGDALARTSRQLNTLEQRVLPEMEGRIREIQRTLEEREREEHQRIRRILGDRRGHPGSAR
jgi:V/A-type H+-transporting ATPase subunit D